MKGTVPDPIRVVIVDDHNLVRAGLCKLINAWEGIEVMAEAADGREALRCIRRRPDVVLMDIAMPGLNGLDATLQVKQACPAIHVIMLSVHTAEEYVLRAIEVGASGYLPKMVSVDEMQQAIRAVVAGEIYLAPAVSKHVVLHYLHRLAGHAEVKTTKNAHPWDILSARQREILQLIAEGQTTKQIASQLHLSVKTVETHRMQLMQRLDIHELAGLVRYAIRTGLVALNT